MILLLILLWLQVCDVRGEDLVLKRVPILREIECNGRIPKQTAPNAQLFTVLAAQRTKACLVFLPPRSRVTFLHLDLQSNKSFVRVMTGKTLNRPAYQSIKLSKNSSMDEYGPFALPCKHGLIMFRPDMGVEVGERIYFRIEPMSSADKSNFDVDGCRPL